MFVIAAFYSKKGPQLSISHPFVTINAFWTQIMSKALVHEFTLNLGICGVKIRACVV
jgi:hypothetical protein